MQTVYVQDMEGNPLDPTTRCGHVRILLDEERARVVQHKPFTIRLCYETKGETRPMYGGTDPGRTNIGNAVIEEDGTCVYQDVIETRNEEIPKRMTERREHRRASRRGERLRRKRRAKKNGTLSTKLEKGRRIPGTEEPTPVKDIINTEARFANRKKRRPVTPTVNHLIETTLQHVDDICRLLPVHGWCLEVNRFAFMKMEDGKVFGTDYQNGRMKGYDSVEDYIRAIQKGKCPICGKPIEAIHHIIPGSKGGSDLPENRIGLCGECHAAVHQGNLSLDRIGEKKRYGALSVLNQAVPYIYQGLVERFGEENVRCCTGWETEAVRETAGLAKDHDVDALCIASLCTSAEPGEPASERFRIRQFRRQDRARINAQTERTYKLNGKTVAKNRKPRFEQKGPSLADWYASAVETAGKKAADVMLAQLKVSRSYRRRNDPKRMMPGTVIQWKGITGILTGQQNGGTYYTLDKLPKKRLRADECVVLRHNKGLVYV